MSKEMSEEEKFPSKDERFPIKFTSIDSEILRRDMWSTDMKVGRKLSRNIKKFVRNEKDRLKKEELEEHWCYSDKSKKYPSYRMWKLDYIMAGDFSYSFDKYKRWLLKQKIKDFWQKIKNFLGVGTK